MSYETKIAAFVEKLQEKGSFGRSSGSRWAVESGRKFDKVYLALGDQKSGRYMVERKTGNIYAIKSWAQVNMRRWFGSLDTIDQFDWSPYHATPLSGTVAAVTLSKREQDIAQTYKKRGRPRKVLSTSVTP